MRVLVGVGGVWRELGERGEGYLESELWARHAARFSIRRRQPDETNLFLMINCLNVFFGSQIVKKRQK